MKDSVLSKRGARGSCSTVRSRPRQGTGTITPVKPSPAEPSTTLDGCPQFFDKFVSCGGPEVQFDDKTGWLLAVENCVPGKS